MGFVREFKDFAFKGNVIDLAVAVIIGGAFGKIVTSLVEDVITPLLLSPMLEKLGLDQIDKLVWNGVKYGNFLSSVISFLCIAFVIFWLVKVANKVNPPAKAEPAGQSSTDSLLMEIRDELKRNNL